MKLTSPTCQRLFSKSEDGQFAKPHNIYLATRSSVSQMTSARGLNISAEADKDEFMSQ